MSRVISIAAVLSSALCFAYPAAADVTNLLTNGSFETGDFSGWTTSGNPLSFSTVETTGSGGITAEDGGYYVLEGPFGSMSYLSQSFDDQTGQTYTISGWVFLNVLAPGEVAFFWDPASVNPTPVPVYQGVSYYGWTPFSTTVTGSGHDTFQVGFRNDPAYDGLDNFAVVLGDSPPEPPGSGGPGPGPGIAAPEAPVWVMMVAGFAALGLAAARARRRSSPSAA